MLTTPFLAVAAFGALAPLDLKPIVGTFRYDPVELIRTGKSVVGAYSITQDHHAYRYLFVTEDNRKEFVAHPDRYEIQLGGGCGKMGPLSGRGNPDRFAVHDGKIYIFASDGCRTTFLSNPANFVDKDDEPPLGTASEAAEGRALIAKALQWAGGADRWRTVKTLQIDFRETVKSGNADYDHRSTWSLEWPHRIRRTDRWNETAYGDLFDGENGYFLGSTEVTPMAPQQIRALQRLRNHLLPSVLKAAAEGRGFTAFAKGTKSESRRVQVYFDRTAATLEIHPQTGEIAAIEFRERRQGHVTHRQVFKSFLELEGLKLPEAWTSHLDGTAAGESRAGQTQYRFDLTEPNFDLPR